MLSKPLGVAALAIATVAAAGAGSYLALRSNPTQAAPATSVAPSTTPAASAGAATPASGQASPAGKPVAETEAVVTPSTLTPAPVEAASGGSTGGRGGRSADDARPSSGSGASTPRRSASRPEPAVNAQRRPTVPASQAPSTTTARRDTVPAPVPRPSNTVPAEPASNGQGSYGQSSNGQNRPTLESEQARATPPPAEPTEPVAPPPPPEPPKPTFAEYVLDSGSVMGLQIENSVSSATAKIEDRVDARVTRDVRVGGELAVPAGSRLRGEVTLVEEGGKFKEQARLGIRFHTLVLADGTSVPIATETLYRVGEQMGQRSAAKIGGGAIGGAIIGAILGGGKGAAIGGAAGAGAGTAATMAGNRSTAVMQAGSTYTVRLTQPATVRVEKEN